MSSQNINLKNFSSLDSPLSGEEKKEKIKTLRAKLGELQLKIQEQKLPVLVLVEGWGASGKGSRISSMIRELDPRFFRVISVSSPSEEELAKPFLYRHMKNIPENGKFIFLDSGWMDETIRVSKLDESVSSNIWIDWKKLKFLNVSFAITDIF